MTTSPGPRSGVLGSNLGVLLDERAIGRQLVIGGRAIDRLDAGLWRSMWHDDGELEDEVRGRRGRGAAFADELATDYAPWVVHSHQLTSAEIEVDGEDAVSHSYGTAILRRPGGEDGPAVDDHHRVCHHDRWAKRDGRWALVHRRVERVHSWQQVVAASRIGRLNRRDRDDPSYAHLASITPLGDAGFEDLLAERAIRRQLHTYCRAIDLFDVPMWRSVWSDDGMLDYSDVGWGGRAEDLAAEIPDHYPWASHTHQSTSSLIVVSGDRAVSETYSTNLLFARLSESDELIDSHYRGRYLDEWSRRDGRWVIKHRRSLSDLGWDQPTSEGRVGLRAHRDDTDPSYRLFGARAH
jgi:hypothetical protein